MDTVTASARRAELRRAASAVSPEALARDEAFWATVRGDYAMAEDFAQLEYGYYHPCNRAVLAVEIETMRAGQRRGSHYKRREMTADREAARADLARVAGASPEEIGLMRNATDALNIIVHGLPLRAGDEIVHSDQDYPSTMEALDQRAQRDGLILRAAPLPLDPVSEEEVIARYAAQITPRTRVLVLTHVINFSGQVLPLRKLCALGRERGLHVVVDAAHSFAQLDFSCRDLGCDYLAASLHKWLGAPLGTGLLYVRDARIAGLAPLYGDTRLARTDIRKLEHFGNMPDSAHTGLREAIRWHEALGAAAKGARLHYLQRRWTDVARILPRVRVLTPTDPRRHAAIGTFTIEGLAPSAIVETVLKRYGLFTNAITHPVVTGVRVTPGVPTLVAEVDRLITALREISAV